MKLVIARYKEDVSWAKGYDHFIVQKGEHMDNVGREPASYLWYIINNYNKLSGQYMFVQGNPFDHCKELPNDSKEHFVWLGDKVYYCDSMARPSDSINLKEFAMQAFGIEVDFKTKLEFKAGCQFIVSADTIKMYSLDFYKNLYKVVQNEKDRYPWAFERFVGLLFHSNIKRR